MEVFTQKNAIWGYSWHSVSLQTNPFSNQNDHAVLDRGSIPTITHGSEKVLTATAKCPRCR